MLSNKTGGVGQGERPLPGDCLGISQQVMYNCVVHHLLCIAFYCYFLFFRPLLSYKIALNLHALHFFFFFTNSPPQPTGEGEVSKWLCDVELSARLNRAPSRALHTGL